MSRIFDMDYKSALTLKKVTLVNGLAVDGGAIRMRSRAPEGMSQVATEMHLNEATRLTIRGGAIRDCEATGDGGAISHKSGDMMFGRAASGYVIVLLLPRLRHPWHTLAAGPQALQPLPCL